MSYPQISKKKIDKIYKPNLNDLIKTGNNINLNLNALKYDHFTNQNLYEQFATYENSDSSVQGIVEEPTENGTGGNSNIDHAINTMNTSLGTANLNREITLKTEELTQLENQDLSNQLKQLQGLQTTIFSKERLIEDNMYEAERNATNIRVLSGSIIFGVLFFVLIYVYGIQTLGAPLVRTIGIALVVIYILFIFYQYNIFYLKDSIGMLISFKFLSNIGAKIDAKTKEINKRATDMTYDLWVQNHCSCPTDYDLNSGEDEEDNSWETGISGSGLSGETEVPGVYYQDGSAPNQLLVPTNSLSNSGRYKDKITYSDYNEKDPLNSYLNNERNTEQSEYTTLNGEQVPNGKLVGHSVYTNGL